MRVKNLFAGLVGLVAALFAVCAITVCAGAEESGDTIEVDDYLYQILDDETVCVYSYNGSAATLNIPSEVNGRKVTGIYPGAFSDKPSLVSVTMPDGVTGIGAFAFDNCASLTSITIPDSVSSIDMNAFYGCDNLKDVYYSGSKAQWDKITIGTNNDKLLSASIHCDHGKVTAPSAVTGLKVKSRSADALRLSWDKNTTVDGYIIEIKSGNSWTRVGKITNNSTVEFRKAGLKAGTAYTFRVCAYKMDGKTALYSGYISISARTDPSAVSDLKLAWRSGDALRIAWAKNTSADGYIIEMQNGSTWTRVGKITKNSSVEFKKSKLNAGTAYSFRVCAYKMDGKTALYSGYKTISAMTSPSAVSGFKLKARSSSTLRLMWIKNTSADGYILEQKSGGEWKQLTKFDKNTTAECRITGLKASTAYSFRIKSYKESGTSILYSGYVSLSARTNPTGISGFKLKARSSSVLRIMWDKNTSADGYILEQQSGGEWKRLTKFDKNTTTECRITGLKAGTAYSFRIKSYKMSGTTALYSGYSTLSAMTYPSAVSGLKLKAAAKDAVRLAWDKNTSADGYIIEMKSGDTWTRVSKITKNSTVEFRKGGLKSKTSYSFRIKAYKMSGKTALYGATKTITVKTK